MERYHIEDITILGLENVSVPFGDFQNCIVAHRRVRSAAWTYLDRIKWRCPGIGEVKEMRTYPDGTSELRSSERLGGSYSISDEKTNLSPASVGFSILGSVC